MIGPLRLIDQVLEDDSSFEHAPLHVVLPRNVAVLAKRILETAGIPTVCADGRVRGRRVSITRRLNLAHLPLLALKGFERVYMEDDSIPLQWQKLVAAQDVVGIHGAGLARLGFCAHRPVGALPPFRLVELFSLDFSSS